MLDVFPILNGISKLLDIVEIVLIVQLSVVFLFGSLLFLFIVATKAFSAITSSSASTSPSSYSDFNSYVAFVVSKINYGALWLSLGSMIGASLLSVMLFLGFDNFIMPIIFDSMWIAV